MAFVLKKEQRDFIEDTNKVDQFRLYSDTSRTSKGIQPKNLNFDLRKLNPGQFSAPYHFHRHAEELFLIVSGAMMLRSPEGIVRVKSGDLIFCEMGETGAHQFYNQGTEPCVYLDVRTFIGFDVCEYPDSGKLLFAPSYEIYSKDSGLKLFDGETNILEKWKQIKAKPNRP